MTAKLYQLPAPRPCQACQVLIPFDDSCWIVDGGVLCIPCGDRRGLGDLPEEP